LSCFCFFPRAALLVNPGIRKGEHVLGFVDFMSPLCGFFIQVFACGCSLFFFIDATTHTCSFFGLFPQTLKWLLPLFSPAPFNWSDVPVELEPWRVKASFRRSRPPPSSVLFSPTGCSVRGGGCCAFFDFFSFGTVAPLFLARMVLFCP